jgi:hypothetical protein
MKERYKGNDEPPPQSTKLAPQICNNPAQGGGAGLPKQMGESGCAAHARLFRIIEGFA